MVFSIHLHNKSIFYNWKTKINITLFHHKKISLQIFHRHATCKLKARVGWGGGVCFDYDSETLNTMCEKNVSTLYSMSFHENYILHVDYEKHLVIFIKKSRIPLTIIKKIDNHYSASDKKLVTSKTWHMKTSQYEKWTSKKGLQ